MLGFTHSEQSDSYTKLQAIPFNLIEENNEMSMRCIFADDCKESLFFEV